jgi:protein-S-isoprenylcysteine O-methyltransferase Ste14
MSLLKSILHNIGVLIVGFVFAFLCTRLDLLFGIQSFGSHFTTAIACLLLAIGFLLRVWATFYFYERQMDVIRLAPQKELITSGPYRFSRNPLYLGGNVFIFLGAALFLGSTSGIFLTILHLPFMNIMIRREEKQLARDFGEEWMRYKNRVRRWL